jgi:hypothetical protein
MKTTIDMAREAWLDTYGLGKDHNSFVEALNRFAVLVRADERELRSLRWDEHIAKAVEAEREACAKVCEQQSLLQLDERVMRGIDACTDAIRDRGQA